MTHFDAHFFGRFLLKVDGKFRYSFPTEYKNALKERARLQAEIKGIADATNDDRFVLTRNPAMHCIWGLPPDVWEQKLAALNELPMDMEGQKARWRMIGGAHVVKLDSIGRVLIPASLRSYAGIEPGEMIAMGNGETFQLWSPRVFEIVSDDKPTDLTAVDDTAMNYLTSHNFR